jgi:hypothetical protein
MYYDDVLRLDEDIIRQDFHSPGALTSQLQTSRVIPLARAELQETEHAGTLDLLGIWNPRDRSSYSCNSYDATATRNGSYNKNPTMLHSCDTIGEASDRETNPRTSLEIQPLPKRLGMPQFYA